ncbi:LOW QUALITY PROTEIN: WPP domain-interacting protein 1-like [Neltuma alba]|uniref:LOW QUALITY PROTEIN: WPP domain-interacting protein 1-like n=1 Tax=Neltuma alba TaxID=207710 RepID=UPI0010A3DFD0|nr:LOW QUALITY PROTEIN: WPP domain-interacting protein 1-like [Prosopis alba]
MDLESECSVSVEDNEVRQNESPHDGENETESNLSCPNGDSPDQKGKLAGLDSDGPQRLSETNPPGTSPRTKGYGLKKWRRIKRDVVKDQSTHLDSSKFLKRGLSGAANSTKAQPFPHDIQQNSEGSIGSSNALKNVGFTDGFTVRGSSSDSRYAVGSAFAAGTDSENSEDRSSKSSTAGSAPHSRYDLLGYAKENSQSRNTNFNDFSNSTQKVPHGKGQVESSKKLRGERVKARKKSSHSSMDSDSRSSNFNRGAFTVTSNGKHSGGPNLYYEGNSGDAHAGEHFLDEVQAGYCKENVVEDEDLFQGNLASKFSWDLKEEKSDNKLSSTVEDPLAESIRSLQSVQQALAEEVQKFREIGHEHVSPDDDSIKGATAAADIGAVDPKFHESSLSDQSEEEGTKQTASSFFECQVMSLTKNVNNLELKLEETQRTLAVKNSRIAELETSLRNNRFPSVESSTLVHLSEEFGDAVFDLDDIFRQKIESEVECLLITKMMHDLKVETGFRLKQLEEQEVLSGKRTQVLPKLSEAQSKASVLKNQSEELENLHDGSLEVEETIMMQKRVYKVTFCFWIQFILLIVAFWLFMSQLAPNARVVVPT